MEKNFFRTGYVMVSRTLLLSMFEHHGAADSDEEAFLRMLVHVNYRDAELERPSGRRITCLRGESVIAFATWQRILGWSRGRVMRFFNNCFRDGSVEHVEDGYCRSHVRIPDYDVWSASGRSCRRKNVNWPWRRLRTITAVCRTCTTAHRPPPTSPTKHF